MKNSRDDDVLMRWVILRGKKVYFERNSKPYGFIVYDIARKAALLKLNVFITSCCRISKKNDVTKLK